MTPPFPREALAAAGHRFEQARGQRIQLTDFDEIMHHKLTGADPEELAQTICDSAASDTADSAYRQSAYFVLGKKHDEELTQFFIHQLRAEFAAQDHAACYQLLISLDNLDIDVFADDRDDTSVIDAELNMRDTKAYLATLP